MKKQNRREHLASLSGLVLSAFGTGFLPSCQRATQRLDRVTNYWESKPSYLQHNEYLIPTDVLETFVSLVDPDSIRDINKPAGGYLSQNFLEKGRETEFRRRLEEGGYDKERVLYFSRILTTPDTIILDEKTPQNQQIEYLIHERTHREIQRLKPEEREYLLEVARELTWKKYSLEEVINHPEIFSPKEVEDARRTTADTIAIFERRKKERGEDYPDIILERALEKLVWLVDMKDIRESLTLIEISKSPEELYAYLTQGKIKPRAEKAMKEFPRAYQFYSKIKAKVRDIYKYDPDSKPISLETENPN